MAKEAKVTHDATAETKANTPTEAKPNGATAEPDWSYKAHGHHIPDMRHLPQATLRYALAYGLNKIVQDHVSGDKAELAEAWSASPRSEKQAKVVGDAEVVDPTAFPTAEAFADAVVDARRHAKLADLIAGVISATRTRATSWEQLRKEAAAIVLEEIHTERGKAAPSRSTKDFKTMVETLLLPSAKNASRVDAKAKELSERRSATKDIALEL